MHYLICCSMEFLPKYLVLLDSIKEHDPDYVIHLLWYGNGSSRYIVKPNIQLYQDKYPNPKSRYHTLLSIFESNPQIQNITILGADCYLTNAPDALKEVSKYNDIVLTPHICSPLPSEVETIKYPNHGSIHLSGLYNSDVTTFRNTPNTRQILRWLLLQKVQMASEIGWFNEQTYYNYLPLFFENIHIFKNLGYNIAYWNIHQRNLTFNGRYFVDDQPAVIFHFSGYTNPTSMSKHQNRWIAEGTVLQIYQEYDNKLQEKELLCQI